MMSKTVLKIQTKVNKKGTHFSLCCTRAIRNLMHRKKISGPSEYYQIYLYLKFRHIISKKKGSQYSILELSL